ncbi:MAG: hypothetical protein QM775_16750 [Pirellulales bacterium]
MGTSLIALLVAGCLGDAPAAKVQMLHTEADVVVWAVVALSQYAETDRPYVRFVEVPPWGEPIEWRGVMDFAVNSACGHTRVLRRSDPHANGWLLAYNLRLVRRGRRTGATRGHVGRFSRR